MLFFRELWFLTKKFVLGLTKYKKAQSRSCSHKMLTRKNKLTKTFSIFHLFHGKVESIFNLCGTNLEIIPQFYHTPKYTTPTLKIMF